MVRRDEVLVDRDTTADGAGDIARVIARQGREDRHDDLRRAFTDGVGVTPDSDVTAYRRIGERCSHTWFVLHEIPGYERVDGPWTGCGIPVGVPVER